MTKLAIDTLKKTLKRLEDFQTQDVESVSYFEKELFETHMRIAANLKEIDALKATIALLEKV